MTCFDAIGAWAFSQGVKIRMFLYSYLGPKKRVKKGVRNAWGVGEQCSEFKGAKMTFFDPIGAWGFSQGVKFRMFL